MKPHPIKQVVFALCLVKCFSVVFSTHSEDGSKTMSGESQEWVNEVSLAVHQVDELLLRVNIELSVYVLGMASNRILRYEQLLGDAGDAVAAHDEGGNLPLALAQRINEVHIPEPARKRCDPRFFEIGGAQSRGIRLRLPLAIRFRPDPMRRIVV